ncbi:hypothetical protein RJ641_032071 [Dillenia turbinata]|uniref:DUF7950 domain-containing protein n=1 Tax=Dillenia turbinata TaxID=194707 RepID=A0AAN8W269_9MAGN
MMLQSMNPYATAKTAEIMSRYRPIAPKPELPNNIPTTTTVFENSPLPSPRMQNSPYYRNLWPQLQSRPTRTRKRSRTTISPPFIKRPRTDFGFTIPCHVTSPAKNFSLNGGFAPGLPQLPVPCIAPVDGNLNKPIPATPSLVTLPLLPTAPSPPLSMQVEAKLDGIEPNIMTNCGGDEKLIDLNTAAEIPEEKDLLQQLQVPTPACNIIAPQPVRPIGSIISVGSINEDSSLNPVAQPTKKPEEVEEEVESDALPAIISDSNNKVRLVNSAYKEMVGQPECLWLDSMVISEGRNRANSSKRIGGEVMLQLSDSGVPTSSNGFSCWVRIEWESNGKKNSIKSFCDVVRLWCESKAYLFTWRFHTREASKSSSNV